MDSQLGKWVRDLLNYFHARMELGQEPAYRVSLRDGLRTFVVPITPYEIFNEEDIRAKTTGYLFHEMGHLLVAAPSRRNRIDYGIPGGSIGDPFWDNDDLQASLVEVELCRQVGIRPRTTCDKLYEESPNPDRSKAWFEHTGRHLAYHAFARATDPDRVHPADWKIDRTRPRY